MIQAASPFDASVDAFDVAEIAGKLTPGIVEFDGLAAISKFDIRTGPGYGGAAIMYIGRDVCAYTMRFILLTAADWQAWLDIKPLLEPPKRGSRNAASIRGLKIKHPLVNSCMIDAFVVKELPAPVQRSPGEFIVEVKCLEYRPLIAQEAPVDGQTTVPEDPIEQQIKAKLMRVQAQLDELLGTAVTPT